MTAVAVQLWYRSIKQADAPMSYQYSRLRSDEHRDVAHWRGAKGGVRVLSLPSCASWLQRQANDASYDFWADMCSGVPLVSDGPYAHDSVREAAGDFVLHKDADGAWFIEPWQADEADVLRQEAANGADGAHGTNGAHGANATLGGRAADQAQGVHQRGGAVGKALTAVTGDLQFIIDLAPALRPRSDNDA